MKAKTKVDPVTGEVRQDEKGYEVLDPTPVAPPVGFFKQPSMVEHIRSLVRSELLRKEALEAGAETFEEADDFDVGDDFDPTSPYEMEFEPEVPGGGAEPHGSPAPVAEPIPDLTQPPQPAPPPSPSTPSASDPDYQAWLAAKTKA